MVIIFGLNINFFNKCENIINYLIFVYQLRPSGQQLDMGGCNWKREDRFQQAGHRLAVRAEILKLKL
jgi:hypothetical protein